MNRQFAEEIQMTDKQKERSLTLLVLGKCRLKQATNFCYQNLQNFKN